MKRRHGAKFWILMTVLGVVGGAGLVGFQYSNLQQDKQRVDALRADTQDEAAVQASLERSKQNLEEAKARLTHLEQGIPSTAYIPTMLQELEKTGRASGISVTGVRPVPKANVPSATPPPAEGGEVVAKPAYDELQIEVKGRGTYGSALKFVQALQKFPKIVGARTLDIVPCVDPKDAKEGLVEITVGMRAFLFPQDDKKKDEGKEASA